MAPGSLTFRQLHVTRFYEEKDVSHSNDRRSFVCVICLNGGRQCVGPEYTDLQRPGSKRVCKILLRVRG